MRHEQSPEPRYVVMTADDVGRSQSINRAAELSVESGAVGSVSVMTTGEAFKGAIDWISHHSDLSVGLHVTLSGGQSALPHAAIPDLVDAGGRFPKSPAFAGILYWKRRRSIGTQIADEIAAQFDRLEKAGIVPDHVDCHHHLHVHPMVFQALCREAGRRGVTWIRMPKEPLSVVAKLHLSNPGAFVKWLVFGLLIEKNLETAHVHALRSVNNVFGLSGTGRMSEKYLVALLPHITGATNEIYFHPDMNTFPGRLEFQALTSARVLQKIRNSGLTLCSFGELTLPRVPETGAGTAG